MKEEPHQSPAHHKPFTQFILLGATGIVLGAAVAAFVFRQLSDRAAFSEDYTPVTGLQIGREAPGFVLPALRGEDVRLADFAGKPVVINFWATWCLPCREEMPGLVRLYETHKEEGLMILAVNLTFSDSMPEIEAFVEEFDITFPVLLDEDGIVAERLYRIPGLPTSIFIDRDGTIRRIQVGVMTDRQIQQYVAEILR